MLVGMLAYGSLGVVGTKWHSIYITLRSFTVLEVVRGFACDLFINRTSNYGLHVYTY